MNRICAHGVSLDADCGRCIESYGSNRILPDNPNRQTIYTRTNELRWSAKGLEQRWIGDNGIGPSEWRLVPIASAPTARSK